MRRFRFLAAGVVVVALLAGCSDSPEETDYAGTVLTDPYTAPPASLTDTDGQPFSLAADTDQRLTLVFFGYTNCPDICQAVMSSLASAMTRLDESLRDQVDVVFVTTDPARDDEQALREYLDRFDPTFVGLTGDLPTIVDAGLALGVAVEKGEKLPSGGYEVTHGTQVIGIDGSDHAPIIWTHGTSAAEFANDITLLLTGDA
ncbi:SCO family protein [Nocardioides sp.]|uniref:SCO family protein n=1 Tax=Nocardioides sp. TaxID=35761 RepID=UPI002ED461FC